MKTDHPFINLFCFTRWQVPIFQRKRSIQLKVGHQLPVPGWRTDACKLCNIPGVWTSIPKETYSIVIFQGIRTPIPFLDLRIEFENCLQQNLPVITKARVHIKTFFITCYGCMPRSSWICNRKQYHSGYLSSIVLLFLANM